jgi:hypothetical protein
MYELTKIIGPVDLTGLRLPMELKHEFLQRGHITLEDKGDDYDPSDIVAGPVAFITDVPGVVSLYAKVFDGPDKNVVKAHRLSQALKQGMQRYQFKAVVGKTADGEKLKLRVALVPSSDALNTVKVSPTLDLEEVLKAGKTIETAEPDKDR